MSMETASGLMDGDGCTRVSGTDQPRFEGGSRVAAATPTMISQLTEAEKGEYD